MPIYEYKCQICGVTTSIKASMDSDLEAPKCATDGVPMSRDYSSPAIVFKGTGWGSKP